MDEGGDGGRGGPRASRRREMIFEFAEVGIEPVGDGGFEEAAEAFDGVEFRTVGRQGQEPEVFGQARVVDRQVEAGLVLDDHVQRLGIGVGDLLEEERVDVPVDGRGEKPFDPVFAVHLQRLVQVTPLIFGRVGRMDPPAAPAPDPADHRQQSVAMFIQHPQSHGLGGRGAHHFRQARGQLPP